LEEAKSQRIGNEKEGESTQTGFCLSPGKKSAHERQLRRGIGGDGPLREGKEKKEEIPSLKKKVFGKEVSFKGQRRNSRKSRRRKQEKDTTNSSRTKRPGCKEKKVGPVPPWRKKTKTGKRTK